MKVVKIQRAQGEFAKINEDIKDQDIIKLLDSGQIITGDWGDRHVFKINTRNGEKNLSLNQTSMNNLIDALGDETETWKDQEVKVWLITQSVSGKMKKVCYLTGKDWKMVEDDKGNLDFVRSNNSGTDSPTPDDEIKPEDIPF